METINEAIHQWNNVNGGFIKVLKSINLGMI